MGVNNIHKAFPYHRPIEITCEDGRVTATARSDGFDIYIELPPPFEDFSQGGPHTPYLARGYLPHLRNVFGNDQWTPAAPDIARSILIEASQRALQYFRKDREVIKSRAADIEQCVSRALVRASKVALDRDAFLQRKREARQCFRDQELTQREYQGLLRVINDLHQKWGKSIRLFFYEEMTQVGLPLVVPPSEVPAEWPEWDLEFLAERCGGSLCSLQLSP